MRWGYTIKAGGYTSHFLLAMVMRFFFKLLCRWCAVVATLGDKVHELNFSRFFSATFSAVKSPVQGWLHMRFSPRDGGVTIFKKSHHHCMQKTTHVAVA